MFDVVVVGYNSFIESSPAVTAAASSPLVANIFYCDNSKDRNVAQKNADFALEKLLYIDMGGNKGLSHAYNRAVAMRESAHVVIFDDDTEVTNTYFTQVDDWISTHGPADIFVPIVHADGQPFSPCRPWLFSFRPIRKVRDWNSDFSAINSGMVVASSVFERCSYDERLFVDFIDHQFILDARQAGMRIVPMDGIYLDQRYSLVSDDRRAATIRLGIFRHDSAVYYRTPAGRLARMVRLGIRTIRIWMAK